MIYYSCYNCCNLTIICTIFMVYRLVRCLFMLMTVSTPLEVMQRPRLDAETVFLFMSLKRSRSEFLSDFIIGGNKEMTEVLKPTQIRTPKTHTHKIIHQVWRATTSFYLIAESGESRKRHTSPRWCILAQIRPHPPENLYIQTHTMTQDIQHVYRLAQIDPRVDNTHVSTQEIIIRKITEAPILQSQAFVLHGHVIELLIILLSPFFNLLPYTSFILKITFLFITTSRGLISSTAVSFSKKETVWISFNERMRAETQHCTSVLWRDERRKLNTIFEVEY